MKVVERLEERYETQGAKIIERIQGHYEAQEVPFGVVYRWRPEGSIVECECGQRLALTSSRATCDGCGADHAALVGEKLIGAGLLGDEALHPWRYAGEREGVGLPC
jgi:hypothetical protein